MAECCYVGKETDINGIFVNWDKAKIYIYRDWVSVITTFGNVESSPFWDGWKEFDNTEEWLKSNSLREKIHYKKLMLMFPDLLDTFPEEYKKDVILEE